MLTMAGSVYKRVWDFIMGTAPAIDDETKEDKGKVEIIYDEEDSAKEVTMPGIKEIESNQVHCSAANIVCSPVFRGPYVATSRKRF